MKFKDKLLFYTLALLLIGSIVSWGLIFYYSKTESSAKYGGEYIEGIVGQPLHINPVISGSNNTDEDLVQLVYSGLMQHNNDGQLENDLTDHYEISEDKTTYTVYLRKDATWHDGTLLTAADVFFTLNLISDPVYKSPLRMNWQGVETSLIDEYTITFKIKTPYSGFLNNLTFGILPKHIWESVEPEKFGLTDLNLRSVGSGPYKYQSLQKDSKGNITTYKLSANPSYYKRKPYISKITFDFYPDDDSVVSAYNTKEIMGISSIAPQKTAELKAPQSTLIHKFNLPRYFAIFINQTKTFSLANDEIREALSYATDRKEIINTVLSGNGSPVYAPILPGMIGYAEDNPKREYDLQKANDILDAHNWVRGEDGIRAKNGKILEFNLTTTDWEELVKTAGLLKSQWEKIGVRVNVSSFSIADVQQNHIRPREYEALLFGQVLSADPDPYSFWHSSQKRDPGLNLSLFGDDTTDRLIEEGRMEFNEEKRASIYKEFQEKVDQEMPAIFLYSPQYSYPVTKKVSGIQTKNLISPSKRFFNIQQWYIKTKRVWK